MNRLRQLDSLLRLADNEADELHMLAACTGDFPGDLAHASTGPPA